MYSPFESPVSAQVEFPTKISVSLFPFPDVSFITPSGIITLVTPSFVSKFPNVILYVIDVDCLLICVTDFVIVSGITSVPSGFTTFTLIFWTFSAFCNVPVDKYLSVAFITNVTVPVSFSLSLFIPLLVFSILKFSAVFSIIGSITSTITPLFGLSPFPVSIVIVVAIFLFPDVSSIWPSANANCTIPL